MFFTGIITNQKNELYVKRKMEHENTIFIDDKNINNMKNIKFETIVIDNKINSSKGLRKIISNAKYILLNSDIGINLKLIENLNLTIITYGFNNKSTFTVSSITENDIIICLQRIIYKVDGSKIEPEEYRLKNEKNTEKYATIFTMILQKLYEK